MNGRTFDNPRAEEVRLRYLYRRLVLRGRLHLPREAAAALVGPDCAYHLYRSLPAVGGRPSPSQPRSR